MPHGQWDAGGIVKHLCEMQRAFHQFQFKPIHVTVRRSEQSKFRIFSPLYLTVRQPFPTRTEAIISKPPGSIDRNSHFTLQNAGVVGPSLPLSAIV